MFFFTLFYVLFSFLVVFPPAEFVSAGVTVPALLAKYLGSEGEAFVEYHIARVVVTLVAHSLLPAGYIFLLILHADESPLDDWEYGLLWHIFAAIAVVLPSAVFWKILQWSQDSWQKHPVCSKLTKFCSLGEHWTIVAANVNAEFRNFDKLTILISSTNRAYVTQNWIIKVGLYEVDFVHQSDAVLIVNNSDTYDLSPNGRGQLQFINVQVKSTRKSITPFNIRLLSQDFDDLQDRVRRPIIILPNIVFHKTVIEKFVDVFKEQIAVNEKYAYDQDVEPCIGCMQEQSNIKLVKKCSDVHLPRTNPPSPVCTQCNCRPMWCVSCVARWFASRQDQEDTTKWLSGKCPCPLCRATFCILDVAYVRAQ